ncbi:MAG: DUF6163 family protein [Tepidamorphaceae bacterium]|nr:hypothetical protein [Rhodobiaceae bacterium]MCC0048708.1 hypothetical protein [Rhodobiaceae bacterium]
MKLRKTFRFSEERPLGPLAMLWAMRLLALIYLYNGLGNWATIIGYDSSATAFIDLPVQWQVVTVYFAVLMVIAAVGLWFASGWGVATWLFVAVTEMVMYLGFPDLFGENWNAITFNAACIIAYIAFARWAGSPENTMVRYRLPQD